MKKDIMFSKACTEVLEVLNNVEDEDYNKISNEFIIMLNQNKDNMHILEIDSNKDFEEQNLLPETIDLLAYIYRKYWCDEIAKKEFDKKILENEEQYKKDLREKYPDIFPSSNYQDNLEKSEENKEKIEIGIVKYEKDGLIPKIINWLIKCFKHDN